MNKVLNTVQHHRPVVPGHVQQPFDPQDPAAMGAQQQGQPDAETGPFQFVVEGQAEALDVAGVPVRVLVRRVRLR